MPDLHILMTGAKVHIGANSVWDLEGGMKFTLYRLAQPQKNILLLVGGAMENLEGA